MLWVVWIVDCTEVLRALCVDCRQRNIDNTMVAELRRMIACKRVGRKPVCVPCPPRNTPKKKVIHDLCMGCGVPCGLGVCVVRACCVCGCFVWFVVWGVCCCEP